MRLLRVPDVAKLLDVTRGRAYALIREGVIPAVRLGRQVRVDPEVLRIWLSQGGDRNDGEQRISRKS